MATPIVALHGFTQVPASFDPLKLQDLWAPVLAGHGHAPSFGSENFEDEVESLGRTIRARWGGRPSHLLGYSMGARLGLALLLRLPELFEGATLVGLNPGLRDEQRRRERLAWEEGWRRVLLDDGLEAFVQKWESQGLFATQCSLSVRAREAQQTARRSHTAEGLAHSLSSLGLASMPNYWPQLSMVTCCCTLVAGAKDDKFLSLGNEASRLSKMMSLHPLSGVGHNPLLEAPSRLRDLVLVASGGTPTK